jgi:hypothetical protein
VVNGIWLRPLPYRDGDRLVYLRHSASLAGIPNATFSVPEVDDYRQHTPSLDGVAEFSAMTFTMLGVDEPARVRAGVVTGNYFEVMGLGAHLGRIISKSEDGPAAPAVAVLTYDYWHRLFGADPAAVGKTVTLNDRSVGSSALRARTSVSRAHGHVRQHGRELAPLECQHDPRSVHRMTEVFARLAPDASMASARAEVEAITRRLHEEHPEAYDPAQGYEVSVTRLRDEPPPRHGPRCSCSSGWRLCLMIACANVANLTLLG